LWLGALIDVGAIQKGGGLGSCGQGTLEALLCCGRRGRSNAGGSACCAVVTCRVAIALSKRSDNGATREDSVPASVSYGRGAASEVAIVDDQSTTRGRNVAGLAEGGNDTPGSGSEFAVLDNNRADGLVGRAIGHVDTDLAVVDVHRLKIPEPVPIHEHSRVAVVEGQVAGGELLVANEHAIVATIEDEVAHPASRAVVHENTLLLIARATFDHVEHDVLKTRSLSDLPVDTSTRSRWHSSQVDDEVPNLTEEVVLVGVPVGSSVLIWIRVNDSDTLEACCSLYSWNGDGIANELCVVQLDDWLADEVVTRWEVDQSWGNSA